MARGPVRYSELPKARPIDLSTPDTGFWNAVGEAYDTGWIGAVSHELVRASMGRTPGFNGLDHVPEGYGQFADRFAFADSQEQVDYVRDNIDNAFAARRNREARGGWTSFGADMLAGLVDPINAIPLPGLKGIGFMRGAAAGGASIGALSAATEVVRAAGDPTVTTEESMLSIGAGVLFGSALGGIMGAWGAKAVARSAGAAPPAPGRVPVNADGLTPAQVRAQAAGVDIRAPQQRPSSRSMSAADDPLDAMPVERLGDELADDVPVPGRPVDDLVEDGFQATAEAEARQAGFADRAAAAADEDAAARGAAAEAVADDYFAAHSASEGLAAPDAIDISGRRYRVEYGAPQGFDVIVLREPGEAEALVINDAAIIKQWDDGSWLDPEVTGAQSLDPAIITGPDKLLELRVVQALTRERVPRLPDEGAAAYADRINALAQAEVQANGKAFTPTGGTLARLVIRPTPLGQMQELTSNKAAADTLIEVAGDMQVMTDANVAGRATTPGGSVWQRTARWMVATVHTQAASDAAYLAYLNGAEAGSRLGNYLGVVRAQLPMLGARSQGKLTPKEWREVVGRAVFDDGEFSLHGHAVPAEARTAAKVYRQYFQQFEKEMRDLGMFDRQRSAAREVSWRERAIARDKPTLDELEAKALNGRLSKKAAAYLDDLRERVPRMKSELEKWKLHGEELDATPTVPAGETNYFHRIWNKGVIREQREAFTTMLEQRYALDNLTGARERAEKTVGNILGENGDPPEGLPVGQGSGPFDSRQVPLTNVEAAEFLVLDAEVVMGIYARRTAASIEMVRKFGSRDMGARIDEVRASMRASNHSTDEIRKAVQLIEDSRDRVLGQFHAKDPLSWDNRAARLIKSLTNMSLMGKMVFSQIAEAGRAVGTVGPDPIYRALAAKFAGNFGNMQNGPLAKVAGEALEMVSARYMANLIDEGSAVMVTQSTWVERAVASATVPFFTINGNNPMTVIMKETVAMASASILIDESAALARAVRAGGAVDDRVVQRLASFGISKRDALIIADMPWQKEGKNLTLANMDAWGDVPDGKQAREVLLGAINGEIRRTIVAPGPLDRPRIMDGVFMWKGKREEWPLLGIPFQLMSFSLAAGSRLGHSALTGRDRQTAMGMIGLLGMGYLGARWAAPNWDKLTWDQQASSAWNKSSLGLWFGDIVGRAGQAANLSVHDLFAADDKPPQPDLWSDRAGAVAPALSVYGGAVEAFTNPEVDDYQQARLIRRAIPWAGMLWWSEALKDATTPDRPRGREAAGDALSSDLDPLDAMPADEPELLPPAPP